MPGPCRIDTSILHLDTAVLPNFPHSICWKRVPNRRLRPRRGRLGTRLELLECGSFGRTVVFPLISSLHPPPPSTLREAVHSDVIVFKERTVEEVPCRRGGRVPLSGSEFYSRSPKNSCTATVPKLFQIGLCGVVKADLELFCNSWSAGFL